MKILAVSDKVDDLIYTPSLAERMKDIDLILSCGDLPNNYLEFIVTMLNKPLFYVFGNHHKDKIYCENRIITGGAEGCVNIDNKVVEYNGILIAGFEGSMRYNIGKHQYTDFQMCMKINRLKPRLVFNRIFKKRYIDIILTHSPPYGIHDQEDLCHTGFKCFNTLIKKYEPKYFIHGHIHLYSKKQWMTEVGSTKVINAYGYRVLEI
ncbi:MAG: metallophosphoesterase [Actinobacteria bacterium]|nr:metallophosphoesterase [Actinomycetota bacterium]